MLSRSRRLKIVHRQVLANHFGAFTKSWNRQFNTKSFFANNEHKSHQDTGSESTFSNHPKVALISTITIALSILLYKQTTPLLKNESVITKHAKIIIIQDSDNEDEDDAIDVEDSNDPLNFAAQDEIRRQKAIANKPPLNTIFNINDFEYVAQQILPLQFKGYFATGSEDEVTLRENHHAYSRIFFKPRCLVNVADVSLSVSPFSGDSGDSIWTFDAPFYITAFAGARGAHEDAELNLIRAAKKHNVAYMIPSMSSFPIDEVIEAGRLDDGLETQCHHASYLQMYLSTKEELNDFPDYLKKLQVKHDSIKAVFITVDLPVLGNREKNFKYMALADPSSFDEPVDWTIDQTENPPLTWDDIVTFKNATKLPICVKGLQCKEDVAKAIELGLDGCVISNHGGRQLDFSRAPVEVLVETQKYLKEKNISLVNPGTNKKFEIFIDGGVKRGSDVIKALCLGASGVGLGRPFIYSMAGYGQPGVERAIKILKTEMIRDMKLLGVKSIDELNEDFVDIDSLKYKNP
ncbi:unnamed protein product [Ambrosiozyma monospora]|uniref:Unnamed protein product n=1 Tax=Ambrosiozyma monospora TaxID=43982 RepID=A0A9W6Z235_AMBMO|nr:unnamed protein product [Ambrosiozyma monospora]